MARTKPPKVTTFEDIEGCTYLGALNFPEGKALAKVRLPDKKVVKVWCNTKPSLTIGDSCDLELTSKGFYNLYS